MSNKKTSIYKLGTVAIIFVIDTLYKLPEKKTRTQEFSSSLQYCQKFIDKHDAKNHKTVFVINQAVLSTSTGIDLKLRKQIWSLILLAFEGMF